VFVVCGEINLIYAYTVCQKNYCRTSTKYLQKRKCGQTVEKMISVAEWHDDKAAGCCRCFVRTPALLLPEACNSA